MSSPEQRKHPRIGISVTVELEPPETKRLTLATRDISDGGVFLECLPAQQLPIGTVVRLRTSDTLANDEPAPLVRAKVVRTTEDGMGLCFLT